MEASLVMCAVSRLMCQVPCVSIVSLMTVTVTIMCHLDTPCHTSQVTQQSEQPNQTKEILGGTNIVTIVKFSFYE